MKIKIMVIVVCMLFIITASSTIGIDISNDVNDADLIASNYIEDTYLLTTTWGQWDYYNAKCPIDPATNKPHRLGCKSVAIGQIMRYHELESHGLVEYYYDNDEGNPIPLINDLDDFDYEWDFMANWLNGSHTPEEEDHVSEILYDSATVIQKNFGWPDYVINASRMIEEIIDHLRKYSENAKYAIDEYGDCLGEAKWYEHDKEMKNFSRKYPHALFKLNGEGEESEDKWVTYYKNGKTQFCPGVIVYPVYDKSKLK